MRPSSSTITTPNSRGFADALKRDGDHRLSLLVEGDQTGEIEVGKSVAADHEEGVVEKILGQPYRACGARRRLLHGVVDVHPQSAAVAEMIADEPGQKRQSHDDIVDAMPLDQFEYVLDGGLVDHRNHRLGLVGGQRPQSSTLTSGHHDCLHGGLLRVIETAHTSSTHFAKESEQERGRDGRI